MRTSRKPVRNLKKVISTEVISEVFTICLAIAVDSAKEKADIVTSIVP
jgi:hypothetical protein